MYFPFYHTVPPPLLEVSREKEDDIQIGSTQVLTCSVSVWTVNVPTILTIMWKLYSSLLNESRIPISETTEQLNYSLSLEIRSYRLNDSGIYTCIALVTPSANTSADVEGGRCSSTVALNATSGKSPLFFYRISLTLHSFYSSQCYH